MLLRGIALTRFGFMSGARRSFPMSCVLRLRLRLLRFILMCFGLGNRAVDMQWTGNYRMAAIPKRTVENV